MNPTNGIERVYDPALAATLLLMKHPSLFAGIEEEGKFLFGFERTTSLLETIESYWNEELTVEPMAFFDAAQILIGAAYGARRQG